ncbi:MAG: hypothetical protein WC479_07805 [Candidatus Izemoplasmatales bacterium]|jgi:hypothetical protein
MKFVFRALRNPTKTDLTFTWDSEVYSVKAGSEELFPTFIAEMGALRLADRERVKDSKKKEYANSVLGELKETQEPIKPTFKEEVMAAKQQLKVEKEFEDLKKLEEKPWCDKCDSKGVRHKKNCPDFK